MNRTENLLSLFFYKNPEPLLLRTNSMAPTWRKAGLI